MAIVQDEISLVKVSNGVDGINGIQGPEGEKGIPGEKGADGRTQYTHIAYSNSDDGIKDFSLGESNRDYIGMYVDFYENDSTEPSDYSWSLIKGADGTQGTPGKPGEDGKTPYFHTAWANSADGKIDFSTTISSDKKYLGTYTDFTQTDSNDHTKYSWSLIKGADGLAGEDGVGIKTTTIKYGISTSSTIKPSNWVTQIPVVPQGQFLWTETTWVYTDNTTKTAYSVAKQGENGKDGTDGKDGTNGKDGVSPKDVISGYLSNESIIVPATPTGAVTDFSKAFGDFVVFEGQTKKTSGVTYSKVSEVGMTSTINSNGRYVISALSADTGTATYRATYSGVTIDKIMIVVKNKQGQSGADGKDGQQGIQGVPGKDGSNGKDGATGPQGPPTGIATSATVPSNPYVNMLWQNTGANNGYITGVTYQWNGARWNVFIFTAENIATTTLSAISANLGDVKGGSFTGGKFINNFVDIPLLYDSTRKATGQTKIENGVMTITGKIDGTYDFVTKYTVDAISSTIYYPNSAAVMKAFSITPDGFLLADHQNGFSGQLLASALTKTPWVDIPMRSGYSGASHNMPKYKITHNLDGTRTISFRGQIVKLAASGSGVIDMEAGTDHSFADLPVNVRPNVEANGYGVTSSGNGCRVWTYTKGGMGCRIGITKTNYVDLSALSYIID